MHPARHAMDGSGDRRPWWRNGLAAAALLLALAGCHTLELNPQYKGPAPIPPHVDAAFASEQPHRIGGNEVLEEKSEYIIRRLTLRPSVNLLDEHDVIIDYYDLTAPEPSAVVLVLPTLGGDNEIANHFARSFAQRGLAAVIVHRQESYKDVQDAAQLNLIFQQIVHDHKAAIDWIEMQPDLDAGSIGLFGVSAGAVKGVLVAALDDRIGPSVLGLVGGNIPAILAHSRDKGIVKRRTEVLEREGIDEDELERRIAAEFEHDPMKYAPFIDARKVLLVLARFDEVIPFELGEELREAMGGPRTIVLPTGHYSAIIFVPWLEGEALRFLKEGFERPAE